jgi:methylphosphotriester-DNA--protein-cysteine methyltransferase
MIRHSDIDDQRLGQQIKSRSIQFGGNARLRIYGSLDCKSGKRIKRENRVFFESEAEALEKGYRPCGHCMKEAYKEWISLNR